VPRATKRDETTGATETPEPRAFEAVLAELEAIVARLERGDQPLESALADFEKGVRLSREAGAVLEQAELRLARLTSGEGDDEAPLEGAPGVG
jgi:exodeoxyribonuclease VII small subunit